MNKAETLVEIKRAEAKIRAMKESAQKERDHALREARREVLGLQQRLRREAEERASGVLAAAESAIAKERETILAKGRKDAESLRAAGLVNVDRAVELVLSKFQGAPDA